MTNLTRVRNFAKLLGCSLTFTSVADADSFVELAKEHKVMRKLDIYHKKVGDNRKICVRDNYVDFAENAIYVVDKHGIVNRPAGG